MGVLLALIAAIVFGGSDFAAGLASRRLAAGPVAVFVQAVGVAAAGIAVLIVPGAGLTTPALAWGALSGVGTAVGTLGLYHGLSVARMSVVAPVSAVLTAVLPVGVGLLLGERLSAAASAGIVVAVIAIALVSRGQADPAPGDRDLGLRGNAGAGVALGWGSVAGAGFALLFVALDQAGTGSGAWPLLPGQLVSLLLVAPFGWRARPRHRGQVRAALAPMAVAGIAAAAGNLVFLGATGHGQLALVAVITALYPAGTVVLARIVLGERWTRVQVAGLTAATVAIVVTVVT